MKSSTFHTPEFDVANVDVSVIKELIDRWRGHWLLFAKDPPEVVTADNLIRANLQTTGTLFRERLLTHWAALLPADFPASTQSVRLSDVMAGWNAAADELENWSEELAPETQQQDRAIELLARLDLAELALASPSNPNTAESAKAADSDNEAVRSVAAARHWVSENPECFYVVSDAVRPLALAVNDGLASELNATLDKFRTIVESHDAIRRALDTSDESAEEIPEELHSAVKAFAERQEVLDRELEEILADVEIPESPPGVKPAVSAEGVEGWSSAARSGLGTAARVPLSSPLSADAGDVTPMAGGEVTFRAPGGCLVAVLSLPVSAKEGMCDLPLGIYIEQSGHPEDGVPARQLARQLVGFEAPDCLSDVASVPLDSEAEARLSLTPEQIDRLDEAVLLVGSVAWKRE